MHEASRIQSISRGITELVLSLWSRHPSPLLPISLVGQTPTVSSAKFKTPPNTIVLFAGFCIVWFCGASLSLAWSIVHLEHIDLLAYVAANLMLPMLSAYAVLKCRRYGRLLIPCTILAVGLNHAANIGPTNNVDPFLLGLYSIVPFLASSFYLLRNRHVRLYYQELPISPLPAYLRPQPKRLSELAFILIEESYELIMEHLLLLFVLGLFLLYPVGLLI